MSASDTAASQNAASKPATSKTATSKTATSKNSRSRRTFPVTVTRLPVVRCAVCDQTIAHRPGQAGAVLTAHYEEAHSPV